jgi:hypothetical protein
MPRVVAVIWPNSTLQIKSETTGPGQNFACAFAGARTLPNQLLSHARLVRWAPSLIGVLASVTAHYGGSFAISSLTAAIGKRKIVSWAKPSQNITADITPDCLRVRYA